MNIRIGQINTLFYLYLVLLQCSSFHSLPYVLIQPHCFKYQLYTDKYHSYISSQNYPQSSIFRYLTTYSTRVSKRHLTLNSCFFPANGGFLPNVPSFLKCNSIFVIQRSLFKSQRSFSQHQIHKLTAPNPGCCFLAFPEFLPFVNVSHTIKLCLLCAFPRRIKVFMSLLCSSGLEDVLGHGLWSKLVSRSRVGSRDPGSQASASSSTLGHTT